MKKSIILIILFALSNNLLNAQEECFTPPPDNSERKSTLSNYVYDPDGPVKIVRVNFHFLLRTDSTGNFTETSDNYTNRPYNGYLAAEDLVKYCNQRWSVNQPLRHMPVPPVPALPKKVQFQLCGVYFHRNTADYDHYVYSTPPYFPPFRENSGEVINIYIANPSFTNGVAEGGYCASERTLMGNAYNNYKESIDKNNVWDFQISARLICHEVGHLFGLPHTIEECCKQLKDGKIPDQNCHDGIADTPTFYELILLHYLPCEWNHILGSNNVMDYNADSIALSPEQISKMHSCIDGTKKFYRNCKYKTQSVNITSFTTNKAYIAKQVNIPSASNIVVGNNSALFVNAEEFTINGTFEVQAGSIFNVEIVSSCD